MIPKDPQTPRSRLNLPITDRSRALDCSGSHCFFAGALAQLTACSTARGGGCRASAPGESAAPALAWSTLFSWHGLETVWGGAVSLVLFEALISSTCPQQWHRLRCCGRLLACCWSCRGPLPAHCWRRLNWPLGGGVHAIVAGTAPTVGHPLVQAEIAPPSRSPLERCLERRPG